jgi:hypothetical protein
VRSERPECTERSGRCFHESFHAAGGRVTAAATESNVDRRAQAGPAATARKFSAQLAARGAYQRGDRLGG